MKPIWRFVPLLFALLLAGGVVSDEVWHAVWSMLRAVGKMTWWAVWISGPFGLAICLAFLSQEKNLRVVVELSLVVLTLGNLASGALAAVVSWISARQVFFYLPILEYLVLTLLVTICLFVRWGRQKLPKKSGSVTLTGR